MKNYNKLLNYIGKNYSVFLFISVFYSLWLLFKYASIFNPELHSFPGRMIGEATIHGYDISIRVSAFYKAGALFFFSILIFSIIAWRVSFFSTGFFQRPEIKVINYTSLAGIVLWFFALYGSSMSTSLELIYCIHKTMLVVLLLKWILLKNRNCSSLMDVSLYSIAFVIAISAFFVLNEFSVLFKIFPKADFLISLSVTVIIISALTALFIKEKSFLESRTKLNRLAFLLVPLAFIPLLSFFKDEVYLILNRHQLYYFSPRKIYLLSLLLLALYIIRQYFRAKKNYHFALAKNTYQLVGSRYFPLLVLSISTFTFYSPFLEPSTEMFEAGNEFLPVMEFQKFGVIPIIEKFNSHELNDFFFGAIYTFLNGLHGREMVIYDIFFQVMWAILVYCFTYKLTRNAYIALFLVILFPITEALLPGWHIVGLLAIFVLDIFINQKSSLKNYLLLFFSFAFLILWRIDVGYAAIISATLVSLIYFINGKLLDLNKGLLIKAAGILAGTMILLLISISIIRNINVIDKLLQALNYVSSAQTYGHITCGNPEDTVFKMQYFVFPIVILAGIGTIIVFFQKFNSSRFQRFCYIAFLFLAVYYIVNFQRGLVRHSFLECHDKALSSFLFFILGANVYLFSFKKSQLFKFVLFLFFALIFVLNYKVPGINNPSNIYSSFFNKAQQFSAITPVINFNRNLGDKDFENKKFGEVKKFIAKHLSKDQTFIDFSNTPMLYYYTGKISPSYFYQNPLSIHNDYLQKKFIADLNNYNTPLLLFSNFPEIYGDAVDEVPNVLRHYRMAEYFYTNFQPFAIIDNLCIWKRKNFQIDTTNGAGVNYLPDDYSTRAKMFDIKLLPFIWGKYDKQVHQEKVIISLVSKQELLIKNEGKYFNFPTTIDKSSGNTILVALQCDNESPISVELMYSSSKDGYIGSFMFTIPKGNGERKFAVRISSHYNWYCNSIDCISLLCKEYDGIKINQLKILKGS